MGHALLAPSGSQPRRSRGVAEVCENEKGGERAIQCGGCAASFEPEAWARLSVVAVLAGDAIATHVVKWPNGVRIEIRRCPRCGRSMARTSAPA